MDGKALARLKQDDAAKAQFAQYLKVRKTDDEERQRIARYLEHPDLARAMMAPAFSITAIDGQKISMDDLQGKVVLLDFWATGCGPCREALPHIRNIAKKFQGQPLVILSVNLDSDEGKWKEFIAMNEMTWPQYRSAVYTYGEAQTRAAEASREAYQATLKAAGFGPITTEIQRTYLATVSGRDRRWEQWLEYTEKRVPA